MSRLKSALRILLWTALVVLPPLRLRCAPTIFRRGRFI